MQKRRKELKCIKVTKIIPENLQQNKNKSVKTEVFLAVCLRNKEENTHSQWAGTAACMVTPVANQRTGTLKRQQGARVIRV